MNFHEHKKDILAISAISAIIIAITLLLLNIDLKVGVYYVRDVFFYLNNALFYAGYDVGLTDTRGLSPLIPMITSIFFRMGFVSDGTIIIVSSAFYIFSALGMYLLLRLRFDEVLSFTGSILLSTFPLIIVWVTKGMLDIPGLCFSIWSVYFMMLAFRKSTKYFYIAFPLVIFGCFTRYTVFLMVPVLLIQFFLMENPVSYIKNNIKDILIGIGLGTAVFAAFIGIFQYLNINLFFISQGQGISQSTQAVINTTYNNIFYYKNNFLIYLSTQSFIPYSLKPGAYIINEMRWIGGHPSKMAYILMAILIIGLVLYLKKLFSSENRKIMKNEKLKLIIFIIGFAIFLFTFIKISIILSIIIVSISLLVLYRALYKTDIEYFSFDFIMICWFVINFAFFTYHQIKVDRYFIPMLPAVAYFIVLSIEMIFDKLKNIQYMDKIKIIVPIALICIILLCSGIYAMKNSPRTFDNQMPPNFETAASEEKAVGEWLVNHDPQYQNKTIWADRGGDMSFILKMNILPYEKVSNESNFTDEMVKNHVDYFIAKDNKTINEPYEKIYQNGEVNLYAYKNK